MNCIKNTTIPWSDWACCVGRSIDSKAAEDSISIAPIIGAIVGLALGTFALLAKILIVRELAKKREYKSDFALNHHCASKKSYYASMMNLITNIFLIVVMLAVFAMTLNRPTCCPPWVKEDYDTCRHC